MMRTGKTPFRRLIAGLCALTLVVGLAGLGWNRVQAQSGENSRYAAIVVDAGTGEVLFARHADSRRYPASVTKVMTLYLTFEALEKGTATLDDVLTISPLAASQPPSKLGLAAGQTIRLDDAMRATTVRSANDMAMAIAEHIGGSQARFAAMATLKAEELGMTQTRYVNPNGLPDSRQLTSARDLAILARAIMRDYPQYYSYFGLHDWNYQGREYRNTNGLLLSGQGYDGIKTGFTNASGYNLAASAVRNGKRVITIVLGGRSSVTRNAHVAALMDTGFEVETRRAAGERIQTAQTFFEARGFGIGGPDTGGAVAYAALNGAPAEVEEGQGSSTIAWTALPTPTSQPTPSPPGYTHATPVQPTATPPVRRAEVAPPPRAGTATGNLTASLNGGVAPPPGSASGLTRGTVANPPRPAATPPARAATPPAGRWSVQVGAFRDATVARNWLTEVNRRFRTQFTSAERNVVAVAGWHRSRFTGMTEAAARSACEALDARRVTCMVVRPGG
ncbi:D-alanyl-D-alanine carboxypeptidase [Brevundimonas sp.]|uniref:D-alanyl-D-alanine carboxypeptidase n=1 Tax=Brevundimonas sp. TaxID=1871086 RepID=UPI00262ABE09|nr:D-alanyl-D-alanine carboxypeptidase [Brevundimonas sp.]